MKMFSTGVLTAALLIALCTACGDKEKTSQPEPAVSEEAASPSLAVAPRSAPEPEKPAEPAVPKAEIEKAARFYSVLHAPMSEEDRIKTVDSVMEANGWTEDSYRELLYDIAQDPPSRAAYLKLTHGR